MGLYLCITQYVTNELEKLEIYKIEWKEWHKNYIGHPSTNIKTKINNQKNNAQTNTKTNTGPILI